MLYADIAGSTILVVLQFHKDLTVADFRMNHFVDKIFFYSDHLWVFSPKCKAEKQASFPKNFILIHRSKLGKNSM